MADSGQNYSNHVRWFPPFHFFVAPVLLINVFVTGWMVFRAPSGFGIWELLVAIALFLTALLARLMALAVQEQLQAMQIRVPVVGFGDGTEAAQSGLTTVAANITELGQRGARQLMGQIDGLKIQGITLLSVDLIVRESSR